MQRCRILIKILRCWAESLSIVFLGRHLHWRHTRQQDLNTIFDFIRSCCPKINQWDDGRSRYLHRLSFFSRDKSRTFDWELRAAKERWVVGLFGVCLDNQLADCSGSLHWWVMLRISMAIPGDTSDYSRVLAPSRM